MASILFLFIISFKFDYCTPNYFYQPLNNDYEYLYSTIIFKHGISAPVDKIPGHEFVWNCTSDNWLFPGGDPLNDELQFSKHFRLKPIENQSFLLGNCRAGELLDLGINQIKNLATFLKKIYANFIPISFNRRILSFRSSYTNRCMSSIQILAQNLFPNKKPIDVFVANEELDSIVPNPYLCPALSLIYDSINQKNPNFSIYLSSYNKHLNQIQNDSKMMAVPHWMRMTEYLTNTKCAKFPYPGTFSDSFLNESTHLFLHFFKNSLNSFDGLKYGTGILISEIFLGMRDYLAGRSDSQLTFISGHTLTFISIFSALNLSFEWPPYASFISFDLLLKKNSVLSTENLMLRVLYNGKIIKEMAFSEFEKWALKIRPTEEECNIKYPFIEKDKKSRSTKYLSMSFS